jgi:hypothetical protein
VVFAFRGRNVLQNSEALTAPVAETSKTTWRPWWLQ